MAAVPGASHFSCGFLKNLNMRSDTEAGYDQQWFHTGCGEGTAGLCYASKLVRHLALTIEDHHWRDSLLYGRVAYFEKHHLGVHGGSWAHGGSMLDYPGEGTIIIDGYTTV